MVKSDSHMERIRQRLLDESATIQKGEMKRKEREGKKFGKQVQVEKLKEREKSKKDMEERLKSLKRSKFQFLTPDLRPAFLMFSQNEKMCWTICKEKMMPLISQLKMPFRTDLQNEEEGEDVGENVVFLAKFEIKSMVLAEPGGDLNKIRRNRQTTSGVIQGADEVVDVDVDVDVGEVEGAALEALREAEPASDREKQGG